MCSSLDTLPSAYLYNDSHSYLGDGLSSGPAVCSDLYMHKAKVPEVLPFDSCVDNVTGDTGNVVYNRFSITLVGSDDVSYPKCVGVYQPTGEDKSNILLIKLINTSSIPEAVNALNLVFTPIPAAFPNDNLVPTIYSIFSNIADSEKIIAGDEDNTGAYTVLIKELKYIKDLIFTVSENGIANKTEFSLDAKTKVLSEKFYSDIFTVNPLEGSIADFKSAVPKSHSLPNNEMITLHGLYNLLKAAVTITGVPVAQLDKMEVGAAVEDIRSLFRSEKKAPKPVSEVSMYADYAVFVSSCIKVIISNPKEFSLCSEAPLLQTTAESRFQCLRSKIAERSRSAVTVNIRVAVDVYTMFEEFVPYSQDIVAETFESECAVLEGSECSDDSMTEGLEIKASRPVAAASASKKTPEPISTYGWYAAGGVVVVVVAVAVYVFVL